MKNFKNTSSIAGQSSTNLASPKISGVKHDANLQTNSTLYFQVGLIICLLVTYGLLEMQFEKTLPYIDQGIRIEEPTEILIPVIKIYEDIPESKPIQKQVKILSDVPPIIKPDDFEMPNIDVITPYQLPTDNTAK